MSLLPDQAATVRLLRSFLFTAVTLGTGFNGGEVTPLFFIGATLGNALAHVIPLPSSLVAGMGFVAVFAGAANTPIASTFMARELFGHEAGAYADIACVVSYLFPVMQESTAHSAKQASGTRSRGGCVARTGQQTT